MSLWMILKIFGDVCVLFGILGAFPGYFVHSFPLLVPAVLCAAGVGAASALSRAGEGRLRWLGVLLPVASLLLAGSGEEMRILLPVVLYTAVVIFRGLFDLEYYSYRQYFIRSLIFAGGLYLLLSIFSFLEGVNPDSMRTIFPQETLRYCLVHLITGVILLRQLRLGEASRGNGSRAQMAAVLAATGFMILAFLAAEPMLRQGAAAVFKGILTALFSLILLALNGFQSLLDQVEIQAMQEQVQARREAGDTPFMGPVVQYIQEATRYGQETESYWWVWLVAVIVAAAMYLLLRSYRRQVNSGVTVETVLAVDGPEYGRQDSRRTNRGRVRHYYREFLKMERKRGMKLEKHDTTADILRRISADTDPEGASQLRQIYLRARYDEAREITREQAEAAKNALKRSRGGQSMNR